MRILPLLSIALLSLIGFTAQAQKNVEGVTVPATYQAGETTLNLNGVGVREKLWFELYVGALFLETKSQNGPEIAKADKPMAITLDIISSMITREKMVNAINEGFERSTGDNTAPIKTEIDQLLKAFTGEIVVGDKFDLVYQPGVGVSMYKNSKLATTVKGLKFKEALFGIWLSNDPVDKGLKEGVLGL